MPVDHLKNLLALRARLASLSVATTGSVSLSATATGYARTTGSFLADGFAVGMEVQPVGFTKNTPGVVAAVSALTLSIRGGRTAEAAATGRRIDVGLPATRGFENAEYTRVDGLWYVEEEYLPGPAVGVTLGTWIENDPTYIVKLFGVTNTGVAGLYAVAAGILELFAPHTAIPLPGGDILRVRGDPAPFQGQVLPGEASRPVIVITIPLRIRTLNTF